MRARMLRRAALLAAFLLSCSSTSSTPDPGSSSGDPGTGDTPPAAGDPDTKTLFSKSITRVFVEVAYVPGAEPYVGAQNDFADIWSMFETNVGAVFDGKKTLKIATTVEGMEKLADVPAGDMSKADLDALASTHRKFGSDATTQEFFLVFVNGHFKADDGTVQNDVSGTALPDKGIIAVFKPAYAAYFDKKHPTAQMIEQISVIHQFGHAVGWVNHGVPIADANQKHEDGAHAGHCTNKQCAMSFAFESAKGIGDFIGNFPVSDHSVLYDQECLSDVRIYENNL
jgi:hypothetical protein